MRAAHHLLQDGEAGADAGELARLEDAGDAPLVIREQELVADMEMLFFGIVFVDEDVLIALKRTAREELEASAHLCELLDVDAGDGIEAGEWEHDRADGLGDVGLFGDERTSESGMGAVLSPMIEDPGGRIMMSAPTPRARSEVPSRVP